jgi:hypothetical protein
VRHGARGEAVSVQLAEHGLDLALGQVGEVHLAERRYQVLVGEPFVVLEGSRPDRRLGAAQPAREPLPDREPARGRQNAPLMVS